MHPPDLLLGLPLVAYRDGQRLEPIGEGEDRDIWSVHMTEDVAFYVELAGQADGPLVELAVGSGRVAIPVAQATGP